MESNKIKLSKIASLALVAVFALSGCNESSSKEVSYYAEVTTAAETEETEPEEAEEAITLKYTNIINSNTVAGVAFTDSAKYYKSQLSEPAQTALEDIVAGIVEYRDYITLGTSITEDELNHIMNIIMTNVPEVFHTDFSYKYDLNVSGYIKNFYPIYTMEYSTYSTLKESMEKSRISACTDKTVSEYTFVTNIYKNAVADSSVSAVTLSEPDAKGKSSIIIPTYYSQQMSCSKKTSLGLAKYIQYYCNYMGIENIVVVGDLISNNYGMESLYPTDEYRVYEDDGIYTVSMDICNYHAWNLINIGGSWVNCDAFLDAYMTKKDSSPYGAFLCVPDEITRQTRLFQINNDILGLTPSCSTNNFQYTARNLNFIKNYTSEQILDCVDTFIENLAYNRTTSSQIQFETESNYREFCELFDERMALYNQTHNNLMPKYSTYTRDYELIFSVNSIIYSEKK
jgi:hypothetical protein